jgi:hypothetical protein
MVSELGFSIHHPEQFDHSCDAVEIGECLLSDGEKLQTRRACILIRRLDGDITSDTASAVGAVSPPRSLA